MFFFVQGRMPATSRSAHMCVAYTTRSQFVKEVVEFLADGRGQKFRLGYIGCGSLAALVEELRPLGDVDGLLRGGELSVTTIEDAYPSSGRFLSCCYPAGVARWLRGSSCCCGRNVDGCH